MAVLVTGGAGYVGSVAVEQLAEAGESVVVLDSFVKGHRAAIDSRAVIVEGDIHDNALLKRIFSEHEIVAVMHFAAFIEVGESTENPLKYFDNNVAGAHNVLKAMLESGVSRFVFSSTAAVYGNPDAVPITEDAPGRPINPYGISKWMVEQMLQWYSASMGLHYAALRYFNACGASERYGEDHDPESHLIPNILKAAAGEREAIQVFGKDYPTADGTCVRDYIHVKDIADAHIRALGYLRGGGESLAANLGSTVGNTVLEVIETVKRVTERDFPVEFAPRRAGDSERLVASAEKARTVLGWEARHSDIETIVRDAWRWKCAHPNGYDD
jgi:UDP-glucose 4-epimerase